MLTPQQYRKRWDGLGYTSAMDADTKPPPDPPQKEIDEIVRRTAEIRAGWSETEKEARIVGNGGFVPWSVPSYYTVYVPGQPLVRKREKRTKIYKPLV